MVESDDTGVVQVIVALVVVVETLTLDMMKADEGVETGPAGVEGVDDPPVSWVCCARLLRSARVLLPTVPYPVVVGVPEETMPWAF